MFLKNFRTFNGFLSFIHADISFSNRYNVTYIKNCLLKMSYKRNKENKKSDAELTKKIQYIRSKCNAIT